MTSSSEYFTLVQHAPWRWFWGLAMILALLGFGALRCALYFFWRQRMIEDAPTALVRSAAQGYVELRGMAELMGGEPVHAPASLRPCAWYQYKIERSQAANRDDHRLAGWRPIEHGTSDNLFYLTDTSGSCVVDPDGADVRSSQRNVWYGNTRIPGNCNPRDAGTWAGVSARLSGGYRYTENLSGRAASSTCSAVSSPMPAARAPASTSMQ